MLPPLLLRSRSRRPLRALLLAATVAVVLPVLPVLVGPSVPPAGASSYYLCTGYEACAEAGMSSSGYARNNGRMYWRMYPGHNCTNYVAYRMVEAGMPNERPWSGEGNASHWGLYMSEITDDRPAVGSVAWYRRGTGGGSAGHVAYVEKVISSTEIIVSEDAWNGEFHWRRTTKGSSGWPDGFIHFIDKRLTNTNEPSISGEPRVGQQLQVSTGSWKPDPRRYRFRWYAGGEKVEGARSRTFTPTAAHAGERIQAKVYAHKPRHSTESAWSARTARVQGEFVLDAAPELSGVPRVGETLTATRGSWSPTPRRRGFRWKVDGRNIRGHGGSTLTLDPSHVGKTIRVQEVVRHRGVDKAKKKSNVIGPVVAEGEFVLDSAPELSGVPRVGETLTATRGSWSPTPGRRGFRWKVDGRNIRGHGGSTLTLDPSHVGKTIRVQEVVRHRGVDKAKQKSNVIGPVAPRPQFTLDAAPELSGVPQVGETLTATRGSWSPTPGRRGFRWKLGGRNIRGHGGSTLTLDRSHVGETIRVQEVVRRDGYIKAKKKSNVIGPVVEGVVEPATAFDKAGRARMGRKVRLRGGTVEPSDARVTYSWQRDGRPIPGATGRSYAITGRDIGHRITVKVSATKPDWRTWERTFSFGTATTKAEHRTVVKGRSRRVVVGINPSAPGIGPLDGKVWVRVGTRRKYGQARDGHARLVLRGLSPGIRRVVVGYAGTEHVRRGRDAVKVRVRR